MFCSSLSHPEATHQLPLSIVKDLVDFGKSEGIASINLSGGEPMLYPDITEVIEYCVGKDIRCDLYTSGNADATVWKALFARKFTNLKIVVDYPCVEEEIFIRLTGNNGFTPWDLDMTIAAMIDNKIPVEANIVPNAINLSYLYSTTSWLRGWGVQTVRFLRLVPQGRAAFNREALEVDREIVMEELGKCATLATSKFDVRIGHPLQHRSDCSHCNAGSTKLVVRYDGVVFPCEAFKEAPHNERFIFGSVYDHPISELRNNPIVKNNLDELRAHTKKIR